MTTANLLTADEAADYLRVPVGTLYQWRHKRTGPKSAKIGKHLRYRRDELDRYVSELERASASA